MNFFLLAVIFSTFLNANTNISNDSLAVLMTQDKISNDSLAVLITQAKEQLLNEVKYEDPLLGKKGGIEINPLYTLIYDEAFSFSGSVSIFPKEKNIEIAIPMALKQIDGNDSQARFRVDFLYRYFLGKHRKGRYIMWGLRHATFKDYDYDYWDEDYDTTNDYSRIGISFGVGSRIFSKSGIYWGWSFYAGKYLTGPDDDGPPMFMNFEFLKFGKTF